jgi:hypothetical protein
MSKSAYCSLRKGENMSLIEKAEALLRTVKKDVGTAWRLVAEAELLLRRAPVTFTPK